MTNRKKDIKQPRGGEVVAVVNTDGKLLTRLPNGYKKNLLYDAPLAIATFDRTWADLCLRGINFPAAFDLAINYANEVNGYHYAKTQAGNERVVFNDRNAPMVAPWVKIERMHLRDGATTTWALSLIGRSLQKV